MNGGKLSCGSDSVQQADAAYLPLSCPSPTDGPFRRVESARILPVPSTQRICNDTN
jgi:hypothetical protein